MTIQEIDLSLVEYVEVRGHYLYFISDNLECKIRGSLRQNYEILENKEFLRVNKSTMVNKNHVVDTRKISRYLYLKSGKCIEISRRKLKNIDLKKAI